MDQDYIYDPETNTYVPGGPRSDGEEWGDYPSDTSSPFFPMSPVATRSPSDPWSPEMLGPPQSTGSAEPDAHGSSSPRLYLGPQGLQNAYDAYVQSGFSNTGLSRAYYNDYINQGGPRMGSATAYQQYVAEGRDQSFADWLNRTLGADASQSPPPQQPQRRNPFDELPDASQAAWVQRLGYSRELTRLAYNITLFNAEQQGIPFTLLALQTQLAELAADEAATRAPNSRRQSHASQASGSSSSSSKRHKGHGGSKRERR